MNLHGAYVRSTICCAIAAIAHKTEKAANEKAAKNIIGGIIMAWNVILYLASIIVIGFALYLIIKFAVKNGINESMLVTDEQRNALRKPEDN